MEHSIAVSLLRKKNSETEMVSDVVDSVNWEDHSPNKSRGYNKIDKASNLVSSLNVSTKKAASICRNLYENGVDIGTLSQYGIYKSVFRKADQLNQEIKDKLQLENWSLHFDSKQIEKEEYQVLVLQNEEKEVKLSVICPPNGKARTVFKGIENVFDEYNL